MEQYKYYTPNKNLSGSYTLESWDEFDEKDESGGIIWETVPENEQNSPFHQKGFDLPEYEIGYHKPSYGKNYKRPVVVRTKSKMNIEFRVIHC